MKKILTPVAGVTPIVRAAAFMPQTELKETSLFGISILGCFERFDCEEEASFAPQLSSISITPLGYRCPTFTDMIAAMYWTNDLDNGYEVALGEQIERWAAYAHSKRIAPWRIANSRGEWQIREQEVHTLDFNLAGKIVSRFPLTSTKKIDKEITISLMDWYVYLKTIPTPSWDDIVEMYKDNPPRDIVRYRGGWNNPTDCPWADCPWEE